MACSVILHTARVVVRVGELWFACNIMRTSASRHFYARAALVLLHANDAVLVVQGFAVRMEHARQLADGAVGPAHGGDPRLQVVRIVLVAEVLLACLQDPRPLHLRQVWWWRGENKCDRCRAWEVNSIYFFITHQLLPHHLEMRLVRQ